MDVQLPDKIIKEFIWPVNQSVNDLSEVLIDKIGNGLINLSWKVQQKGVLPIFIQQINSTVFPDPAAIQHNYMLLWKYLQADKTVVTMPEPLYTKRGDTLYMDEAGGYWRAFAFIENSITCNIAHSPEQARQTARTFARFTALLSGFDTSLLKEVIPGFHDLAYRFNQFEEALRKAAPDRKEKAAGLSDGLLHRKHYKGFFETMKSSGRYPKRVMHHDAKISNVLFHKDTGGVICPVDFDTSMPGYYFSDLGDMIRSMSSTEEEQSNKLAQVIIRKEVYDNIIDGYLEPLDALLTDEEKANIHYAGPLMICMQALRFLADYLNGDKYYRTEYAEQNFDRAMNQFILLQQLEKFLSKHYNFHYAGN